jgi:MFS family permease
MNERQISQAKVLGACTVGLTFGYSVFYAAPFGVFAAPLAREFGWTRGDMSVALTIFTVIHIFMSPLAGWFVDRLGVRKVLIPSVILFGLTVSSFSMLSGQIWQYYVGYGVLAVVGVGASPVSYTRLIVVWFSTKRGMALGIALSGTGMGLALVPALAQTFIGVGGWRVAYLGLGLLVIGAVLPFVVPWARYPRHLQADLETLDAAGVPTSEASGLPFKEAVRSKAFFLLSVTFLLLGTLTGALPPHLVPILVDQHIPAMQAAATASVLGLSLIAGRLVMGFLMDRIFAPLLLAASISLMVTGLVMMMTGVTGPWLVVAISFIGFVMGGETDFLTYILSRYIGLRVFARVYGLLMAPWAAGVSLGPLVMAYSVHAGGNYDLAVGALIATTSLAIFPLFFLGPYPDLKQDREAFAATTV